MKCLFCNSENLKPANFPRPTKFNNKIFSYSKCVNCSLVFISPLLIEDDYAALYTHDYHEKFYFDAREIRNDDIVDEVKKHKTGGNVLDYGCGDGWLLSVFAKKGFNGMGVEYDEQLVEKLRERYSNMSFQTISKIKELSAGVDIVHMGDVLEHLVNPSQVLNTIKALLMYDGLLVVQGPIENNKSVGLMVRKLISIIRGKRQSDHKPYHIIFSNARNQLEFFERNGFETLEYKVFETAWPYPERMSGAIANILKYGVAKLSILLSSHLPGKMGNRFIYIGRVKYQ